MILLLPGCDQGTDPSDPIGISDQSFLAALLEGTPDGEGGLKIIDTNGDGQISYAEAEAVTYLDVSDRGITDMSGIEEFFNLEDLLCSGNHVRHVPQLTVALGQELLVHVE